MGSSITKLVRGGLAAMTFGTSELLGIGKAIDPKLKKVGQESALDLGRRQGGKLEKTPCTVRNQRRCSGAGSQPDRQ